MSEPTSSPLATNQSQSPTAKYNFFAQDPWSPSSCSTVVDFATSLPVLTPQTTDYDEKLLEQTAESTATYSTPRTTEDPTEPTTQSNGVAKEYTGIPSSPISSPQLIKIIDNHINQPQLAYQPQNRLYHAFRPRIPPTFDGSRDSTLPKINSISHAILIRNALTQFHLAVYLADERVRNSVGERMDILLDTICEEYMPAMEELGVTVQNIVFFYFGRSDDTRGNAVLGALMGWKRRWEIKERRREEERVKMLCREEEMVRLRRCREGDRNRVVAWQSFADGRLRRKTWTGEARDEGGDEKENVEAVEAVKRLNYPVKSLPKSAKSVKKKDGKFRDAKAWAADDAAEEKRRASSGGSISEEGNANGSACGNSLKSQNRKKEEEKLKPEIVEKKSKKKKGMIPLARLNDKEWPSLGSKS